MEVFQGALASNEKYETIYFPVGKNMGWRKKKAAK